VALPLLHALRVGLRLPVLLREPEAVALAERLSPAPAVAAGLTELLLLLQPVAVPELLRELEMDTVELRELQGLALPEGEGRGQAEELRLELGIKVPETLVLAEATTVVAAALLEGLGLEQAEAEAELQPEEVRLAVREAELQRVAELLRLLD
jgi:hypothetical protein